MPPSLTLQKSKSPAIEPTNQSEVRPDRLTNDHDQGSEFAGAPEAPEATLATLAVPRMADQPPTMCEEIALLDSQNFGQKIGMSSSDMQQTELTNLSQFQNAVATFGSERSIITHIGFHNLMFQSAVVLTLEFLELPNTIYSFQILPLQPTSTFHRLSLDDFPIRLLEPP